MTPEEAIKTIQVAVAEAEWNYPLDYAIDFETAIEALEKQIPKKPTRINWINCPSCNWGTALMKGTQHCPKCGQALDWRETECQTENG